MQYESRYVRLDRSALVRVTVTAVPAAVVAVAVVVVVVGVDVDLVVVIEKGRSVQQLEADTIMNS